MKEICVDLSNNESIINQINTVLNGEIKSRLNEETLVFDNAFGSGFIRNIVFEWGISLIDYDVFFNEETKFTFKLTENNPMEFLFVSEGSLNYTSQNSLNEKADIQLQRYQNIILSNLPNSSSTFNFPSRETIKLNVIQILGDEYSEKSTNFIDTLQKSLKSILNGNEQYLPYQHLGNYSLKLADIVEALNSEDNNGIVRFLNIKGQLNLILALQILEHKNFENKLSLPSSISKSDLIKTKEISVFINEHLQDLYSVSDLADLHGLSAKKMQIGFRLLFGKSVNEYVRDRKLDLARDLISTTELSISEIVYQIGYKSRSYFSKIFFEKFKILPIDYKDLVKKEKPILKKE